MTRPDSRARLCVFGCLSRSCMSTEMKHENEDEKHEAR